MNEIYAGIDLGTDSIKIVVCEKIDNVFSVLSAVSSKSDGIRNGQITDAKLAVMSVKRALKKASDSLGIKITKVLALVPPTNCRMDIMLGCCDVIDYDQITGEDVRAVLKDALTGQIEEEWELITAIPISFKVDDKENIKDPKGMPGKVLEAKVVVSTLPKEPLYRILEVLKLSGVETIDVCFSSTGDYYSVKSKKLDNVVGAIINIGEKSTNVSIFNRGIQIKNSLIPIGSSNVDSDLSYIFKINSSTARQIKESFAVAMSSYADNNDVFDTTTVGGEAVAISQVGASKVVQARIEEILKVAKNEIKNLTKREIRYIIITGGLSETLGFQYLVEDIFGSEARVSNLSTMGIRHNQYGAVYGGIQYFDDKLSLRGRRYNMINKEQFQALISAKQRVTTSDTIMNKMFGHFFDN